MKIGKMWYACLLVGFITWTGCDDDNDDKQSSLNQTDQSFVLQAARANRAEIELGQLAASKATDPAVKSFGQMMVTEHQPALDELKGIANNTNTAWNDNLDDAHQQMRAQLIAASGRTFDSLYIVGQVADHTATQALFQNQASGGQNAQTKAYANKYLPNITMHLQTADSIRNALLTTPQPGTGSGD